MATHFSVLVWEIHGQRNLEAYSLWDHKELDTIEQLSMYTVVSTYVFKLSDTPP